MRLLLNEASDWLLGSKSKSAITEKEVKKGYSNPHPSLPDQLAIVDFCDKQNLFLLNDGVSIGSGFELASIPAEAASPAHLESVFNKIRDTFAAVVPLHKDDL